MSAEGVRLSLVVTVLDGPSPPRTVLGLCARLQGSRQEVDRLVGELVRRGQVVRQGDFVRLMKGKGDGEQR